MKPRPVTSLVPARSGIQFWSSDEPYDALVDNTCFPTIYQDDEPALTPADARRIHFQDVAAGLDMAGAAARRVNGDCVPGTASHLNPGDSPPGGAGCEATNLRGARGDTSPGAA